MRQSLLRGLLMLATTASIGLLTTAANAAATHPSSHRLTASGVRLPHQVGRVDGVYSVAVYPRLSVPGCSRQDGYNGNVEWATFPNPQFVKTWGQLWDVCGVTAHLYLTWYDPDYENAPVATTPPFITTQVNQYYNTFGTDPGYITVTVCANLISGWTCGSPYPV